MLRKKRDDEMGDRKGEINRVYYRSVPATKEVIAQVSPGRPLLVRQHLKLKFTFKIYNTLAKASVGNNIQRGLY